MYFKNRQHAGKQIARKLDKYLDDNVVIVALTDGAIIVGEEIANYINAKLTLLLSRDIIIPGEVSVLGTVDQSGGFVYNSMFSAGQIEEYVSEFHNFIEAEKMNKTYEINHILGETGLIDRSSLRDQVVVLVSDGVKNGSSFDAAMNYLKPVRMRRLIAVAPVTSVLAVDRMHIIADEIHVLNVTDNYFDANHYYDNNDLPKHEQLLTKLDNLPPIKGLAENNGRSYT